MRIILSGEILTSWYSFRFSRGTVLHGLRKQLFKYVDKLFSMYFSDVLDVTLSEPWWETDLITRNSSVSCAIITARYYLNYLLSLS